MPTLKPFIAAALLALTLLPWNVTAIDRGRFSALPSPAMNSSAIESLLVQGLLDITQGKLQDAQKTLDEVVQLAPNYRLAHLIRGDLLLAQAQALQSFGSVASDNTASTVQDMQAEARMRLERYLEKTPSGVPEPIWQLDPAIEHVIVVDASKSRLYLYRNAGGLPVYISDFYITIGRNGSEKSSEGDKRTPLGIYTAGGKLLKRLPDFYGSAAYPLSYPNEWDRKQGKKGHGIWLHGTPSDTYSRPPRASDGCVVITNPDLETLAPILQKGNTPVIIANDLQWVKPGQLRPESAELRQAMEDWRKDWQSQDTERYLSHYSEQFFTQTTDLTGWTRDKRRIQQRKAQVDIALSNISMFRYPNSRSPMAVVTFDQDFRSDALDNRMRKRQYWIYENQRWKILYEGAA